MRAPSKNPDPATASRPFDEKMHTEDANSQLVCSGCGAAILGELATGLCTHCLSVRMSSALGAAGVNTPPECTLPQGFDYIETLGRGGMGVVYLTFQRPLARYVALKKIGPAWQQHRKALDRFMQEARAAARLNHQGIVQILEVGKDDDAAWYTMEYLEGGDLSDLLRRKDGALPWRDAVALVAQIADAIHHAHLAGVAHRDLKPSNILLTSDGTPKVADFGLAWMTGQEARELTATGEILGTPAYLAPECVSGKSPETDPLLADVYSLGALLFHLIAGRPPFIGDHPLQILGAIATQPAPQLVDMPRAGAVPWEIAEVCARSLEKKPSNRYKSAADLAVDLRSCLMTRRGFTSTLWSKVRRRRILISASVVAALIGLTAYRILPPSLAPSQASNVNKVTPLASVDAVIPTLLVVMPATTDSMEETAVLLARGLQDEIISTLSRLKNLHVIAGNSARAARDTPDFPQALRTILGAQMVLTAKVQKWPEKLQVWVTLQDTKDGRVLWKNDTVRLETNLLNINTDIAIEVAATLNERLPGSIKDDLRGSTSAVPEAQRRLLDAREQINDASASIEQLNKAKELLTRAVEQDPTFALAFAELSILHSKMYSWSNDRSEKRMGLAKATALSALSLNPNLPEVAIALGNYYYLGSRDSATALPHFENALVIAPNNPRALAAIANFERREGDFRKASEYYRSALQLDPLNTNLAYNTADTFLRMRDYETSDAILNRSLELMPDRVPLIKLRGDLYVAWKGDLGPMQEDILHRDSKLPTSDIYLMDKIELLTLENHIDQALSALLNSKMEVLEGQSIYLTRDGYEALLYLYAGQLAAARRAAERALPTLLNELQLRPNDARILLHAGQMYAITGDLPKGESLIKQTLTAGNVACVDAFDRGFFLRSLALLLASLGEDAKAVNVIRSILSDPNQTSVKYLALHPVLQRFSKDFP